MAERETALAGEERATAVSRPYWDGLRDGRLVLQRCDACGRSQHYPRLVCRFCGSTRLSRHPAQPRGTVFAGTRVHRVTDDHLKDRVPFDVVIVRLAAGPLLMALLGGDGDAPRGATVDIDFERTLTNGLLTVVPSAG